MDIDTHLIWEDWVNPTSNGEVAFRKWLESAGFTLHAYPAPHQTATRASRSPIDKAWRRDRTQGYSPKEDYYHWPSQGGSNISYPWFPQSTHSINFDSYTPGIYVYRYSRGELEYVISVEMWTGNPDIDEPPVPYKSIIPKHSPSPADIAKALNPMPGDYPDEGEFDVEDDDQAVDPAEIKNARLRTEYERGQYVPPGDHGALHQDHESVTFGLFFDNPPTDRHRQMNIENFERLKAYIDKQMKAYYTVHWQRHMDASE